MRFFHGEYPHDLVALGSRLVFSAGGNFHDNAILVGLYSRVDRIPIDTTTLAHAHVTNAAGYVQESLSFFSGKLITTTGIPRRRPTQRAGSAFSTGEWACRTCGRSFRATSVNRRSKARIKAISRIPGSDDGALAACVR